MALCYAVKPPQLAGSGCLLTPIIKVTEAIREALALGHGWVGQSVIAVSTAWWVEGLENATHG